jgi:hypothetical protein
MERGLHAELPVTDAAAGRTIALPMHPGLTTDEQAAVIAAVRAIVGQRVVVSTGAVTAALAGPVESAAR